MENLNHLLLPILSIFKKPKKFRSSDELTVTYAIKSLMDKLPGFLSCIELGQPSDVVKKKLPIKGTYKYSGRYLLVLKNISDRLGTHLYCKKILEQDESRPVEQLYVIGQKHEVRLMITVAVYIHEMVEGIIKATRPYTLKSMNGKEHRATKERGIFRLIGLAMPPIKCQYYIPNDSYEIRLRKRLQYLENNLKLDALRKTNKNIPFHPLDYTTGGIFKNNALL